MNDIPPWAYLLAGAGLAWWLAHRQKAACSCTAQTAITAPPPAGFSSIKWGSIKWANCAKTGMIC